LNAELVTVVRDTMQRKPFLWLRRDTLPKGEKSE